MFFITQITKPSYVTTITSITLFKINVMKIYFTSFQIGWQKGWRILRDENNKPFTCLTSAIAFVRKNTTGYIGLADKKQMLMNNAMWDNI